MLETVLVIIHTATSFGLGYLISFLRRSRDCWCGHSPATHVEGGCLRCMRSPVRLADHNYNRGIRRDGS